MPAIVGVDVRARLRAFHKQHYGADNMRIVISGSRKLSKLESMLRRYCEDLPAAAGPLPDYSVLPYPFDCAFFFMLSVVIVVTRQQMHA